MKVTNILITGGAGFVPSSLAEKLIEDEHIFVVLVDNLLTGSIQNIPKSPNLKFIKADVNNFTSISAIMTTYKFDYVFHYAAVVGVERTTKNPSWVLKDIEGIQNVLDLCKNTGVKRVFFSSSSEVYGEPVTIPQHEETTPLNSRVPYAVVKNIGECFCRAYKAEFDLDYTIFRFFNTYGPKQSQDFVIAKFINSAMKGDDITLYGDGLQTRTFCFIQDNIDFTLNILKNNLCINEVVNVGNDIQYTIQELAETIIRLTNSSSKIIFLPPLKEGDMTRRQPDNKKMKDILDRELIALEEGLLNIIKSQTPVNLSE
jgi:nucleoside-diphosphate-sugar epimerase